MATSEGYDVENFMRTSFYCNAAFFVSLTVLVFDHLLTFSSEIDYIWRRKPAPFSILFLLNRYSALTAALRIFYVHTVPRPDLDCTLCEPQITLVIFSTVTMLLSEAILTLRVYTVYNYSRPVLGLLSSVWILHLALMSSILGGGGLPKPEMYRVPVGDPGSYRNVLVFGKIPGVLYIVPALVFDTIAGAFLTFGLYRKSGPYRIKMPLVGLIIRDGLLYFTVIFLTNICWVIVHALEDNVNIEFMPLEMWSACITATMIGRLTLNLKMYDPAANNELTFQTMPTLRFSGQSRQDMSTVPSADYGNEYTQRQTIS